MGSHHSGDICRSTLTTPGHQAIFFWPFFVAAAAANEIAPTASGEEQLAPDWSKFSQEDWIDAFSVIHSIISQKPENRGIPGILDNLLTIFPGISSDKTTGLTKDSRE